MKYEAPNSLVEVMGDSLPASFGGDIILPDQEFANPGT